MGVGTEWLIDASGCDPQALRDAGALRALCERVLAELGLRVVGEGVWHRFPAPGGLTGLYLLTESHLACHTYPEHGVATFNLHCCRTRPRWRWEAALRDALGAATVAVREVARGGGVAGAESAKPRKGAPPPGASEDSSPGHTHSDRTASPASRVAPGGAP